jgi:asparagine synthase (glutamine-hydrolysing)
MCGILGVYYRRPGVAPIDLAPLVPMIQHRGPDDVARYVDPRGRLDVTFVRLAIIDLETGNQPLSNEDGSVVIALNGEIYNYVELTEALQRRGHRFASRGDSETLVHLYEEEGDRLLAALQGMYAFALWDKRRERLLLARDPVGIKPLYYVVQDDFVAFASEIKPLLRLPGVTSNLDPVALNQYLSFHYAVAPHTIFTQVKKLRAGHKLVLENGIVEEAKFWDLGPARQAADADDIDACVLSRLDESIRLHLRSDVPVGAFLSGGIDSGLLVARAAHLHPRLRTYTMRFEGSSHDESGLAAAVAERYGTDHRTFTVESGSMMSLLPRIVWACDEPLADSGLLPNFIINELAARDGVKVVLNGTGGDELFAGYTHYFPSPLETRLLQWPTLTATMAAGVLPSHPRVARKLRRALDWHADPVSHYLGHLTYWTPDDLVDLLAPEYQVTGVDRDHRQYYSRFAPDELNAKLYADIKTYLVEDLLLLLDRMTMIHSIEGRVPYLHRDFIKYVMTLPGDAKAPHGRRKDLLRRVARQYLPAELFTQPKMGFSSPVDKWFAGNTGDEVVAMLLEERSLSRPWWNANGLRRFLRSRDARGGRVHHLFLLFMLEVFCRVHVDHRSAWPLENMSVADL